MVRSVCLNEKTREIAIYNKRKVLQRKSSLNTLDLGNFQKSSTKFLPGFVGTKVDLISIPSKGSIRTDSIKLYCTKNCQVSIATFRKALSALNARIAVVTSKP